MGVILRRMRLSSVVVDMLQASGRYYNMASLKDIFLDALKEVERLRQIRRKRRARSLWRKAKAMLRFLSKRAHKNENDKPTFSSLSVKAQVEARRNSRV